MKNTQNQKEPFQKEKLALTFKEAAKAITAFGEAYKKSKLTFKLIIVFFFLSLSSYSQDGYSLSADTYQSIYTNTNQLDSITAMGFANNIAKAAATKYDYIKVEASDKGNTYYYLDNAIQGEAKTKALEFGCEPCLKVSFKAFKNGLKFHSVVGSLEDLLPTWNAVFLKSATKETIDSSFKYREVKNRDIGLDVRFTKQQGVWKIYNWSL